MRLAREQATRSAGDGDDDAAVSLPLGTVAAIGAGSGVLAATSCFPLEVLRRRQMMGELLGLSPVGALTQLVKAEGAQVLINGIRLNCVKVAMGNRGDNFEIVYTQGDWEGQTHEISSSEHVWQILPDGLKFPVVGRRNPMSKEPTPLTAAQFARGAHLQVCVRQKGATQTHSQTVARARAHTTFL